MIMKQSMNSGTLDNITIIFICFKNFRNNLQTKFNNSNFNSTKEKDINNNNSQAFNIKNEYNEKDGNFDMQNSTHTNFDEIRRRLTCYKENSIRVKTNEFINFSNFDDKNFENKPKTSNELLKKNERFELDGNSEMEYKPIITETENENNSNNFIGNNRNNKDSKQLYKIISKKNISTVGNYGKNYESNLPQFKIPQKLNKFSKDINMRKLSPINKMGDFHNGFNSTSNINSVNIEINMNNTSRGGNRFLPKINSKNIGSTTIYNEKKNNNNNSANNTNQSSFRFNKPNQMNYKFK